MASTNRCYGCMKPATGAPVCPSCGYPANKNNEAHHLNVGTLLKDRYLIGKVLGQGGFGITYLGYDQQEDSAVAIKEYYPASQVTRDTVRSDQVHCYTEQLTIHYKTSMERFLREAKALSQLGDVPAIVRVRDCFELNNTAYIVMEYIRGTDLRNYLVMRGRCLSLKETLNILRPVMDALAAVHEKGLVHRDISPDNIMLHPTRGAILLDFGAVRAVNNADVNSPLTKSTEAILKHGFAPLEQYRSRGSLGPWTDVYALCATIYYCLTGRVPPESLSRMMGEEELDWSGVTDLSEQQRQALEKGMAVMAQERTASVKQLIEGLYPPEPKREPKPEPKPDPKPKPDGDILHSDPWYAFFPWRKVLIGCAAVLVLAVGIGAAVLFGGSKQEAAPSLRDHDTAAVPQTAPETIPDIIQFPQTEPVTTATEAATLPPETEAPATAPAPETDLPSESVDRFDTVFYSSTPGIEHEKLSCTWGELPIRIIFPKEAGFSQENVVISLQNHASEELSLAQHPLSFRWDGNTVEVTVPQGLPEGMYKVQFALGEEEVEYVFSVGTPGQIYPVATYTQLWNAALYHQHSQLYLRNDGSSLAMAEQGQRSRFDMCADIFKLSSANGSAPVPAAQGRNVDIIVQEVHVQGSGTSSHYWICYEDYYLGYSSASGIYLTKTPDDNCKWDIHWG